MAQGRNPGHPPKRPGWQMVRRGFAKALDHPRTSLAVGVVGVLATVAVALFHPGSSRGPSSPSGVDTPSRQGSYTPSPYLSPDASCSAFRRTRVRAGVRRVLVDSPGQITGLFSARRLPDGKFVPLVNVSVGDEVEVSARLHNPSYSSAEGVSVSASISADHGACWLITATAHVRSLPSDHPPFGPTLIRLDGGGPAELAYLAGSTSLLDQEGHALATGLADPTAKGGLLIPYAVPGGTAYFLNFRLRVEPARRHRPGAVEPSDERPPKGNGSPSRYIPNSEPDSAFPAGAGGGWLGAGEAGAGADDPSPGCERGSPPPPSTPNSSLV